MGSMGGYGREIEWYPPRTEEMIMLRPAKRNLPFDVVVSAHRRRAGRN